MSAPLSARHAASDLDDLRINTLLRFLSVDAVQRANSGHAGLPLGTEELRLTKENLGWPTQPPLYIPEPVRTHFREALERGEQAEAAWSDKFAAYARAR